MKSVTNAAIIRIITLVFYLFTAVHWVIGSQIKIIALKAKDISFVFVQSLNW